MDRGAQQATVHGVAKSQTYLEVREELKWQEGAGKRGGEGAREEEKGTNGDSLG